MRGCWDDVIGFVERCGRNAYTYVLRESTLSNYWYRNHNVPTHRYVGEGT
ncbi:unnamed protein product [Pylaiella littoralis]